MNITRNCKECNKEFTINKWQKGKLYCTDLCKPGFKSKRGNSVSESNLWKYFQRNMRSRGIVQRVENAFYKGMPDVNYLINGTEGWLELKYIKCYPKRKDTPVAVRHFTKEQKIWHLTRAKKQGRTNVLLQVEKDYYLFINENISMIGKLTKEDMKLKSDAFWEQRINFNDMAVLLCEQ